MLNRRLRLVFAVFAWTAALCPMVALAASPAPEQQKQKAPPTTTEQVTVSCKVPVITTLEGTNASQEKGSVELTIAPVDYQVDKNTRTTENPIPPPTRLGGLLVITGGPGTVYVERVVEPELVVSPDRLIFLIRINNKLPRVFRAAGAVLQFNIGGKIVALDQAAFADLVNAIVPPRSEQQVRVYGPPLSTLPDKTTVGIFIYDIVTKMDTAGNVTEKQNFEWFFNYAAQLREETGERQRTRLWAKR